ncbi:hypothetical protein QUF90_16410 [Desulfococcaceae bacterium HSG9]|nr:hypothetical protein [Desulfococcaceae bacterium HSG9]
MISLGNLDEKIFSVYKEEIVLEVSVEKDVIVAIMAGDDATLKGLKVLLQGAILK